MSFLIYDEGIAKSVVQFMSSVKISLRLFGNLPPLEELTRRLEVEPTEFLRRGQRVSKRRTQPVDMWYLDLLRYDSNNYESDDSEVDQQWLNAASTIAQLAPAIATLDRTQCQADLFISTIREEDQGGLSLPPEMISAAAAAKLAIELSILVMLGDYKAPESVVTTPGVADFRAV